MKLSLSQIAEYTGGKLYGDGNVIVNGFFTDSRQAEKGKMFVAIKGEKTDGHKYIPMCIEKGCNACFSEEILSDDININYVLVENSVAALQKCGEKCRANIKVPVVGITGSVGKTTTKEIISLALSSSLCVNKTIGNANGQIGVPQMVMRTEPEHDICVFEMGMSYPGEMKRIVDIARPNIAVMTNIGVSHIEFHGTRENIMKEKLLIADYIGATGTIFVNGDDDLLCTLKKKHEIGELEPSVVTFGIGDDCDFRAYDIKEANGETEFKFRLENNEYAVKLSVIGLHNVRNALAALCVSEYVGLDLDKAIAALATYKSPDMRGEIKTYGSVTVIDDTYNASPDSMISSLDMLSRFEGRKIAVLSDMLELGSYSEKGHTDVGKATNEKGIDFLIAVGNEAEFIYKGFDNSDKSVYFKTNAEVNAFLDDFIQPNDNVLIKGSRGMHTEEIREHLSKNTK